MARSPSGADAGSCCAGLATVVCGCCDAPGANPAGGATMSEPSCPSLGGGGGTFALFFVSRPICVPFRDDSGVSSFALAALGAYPWCLCRIPLCRLLRELGGQAVQARADLRPRRPQDD